MPADPSETTVTFEVVRAPGFVQSLERGLAVLRCFDATHSAMTLSQVAQRTGLTRAAARRFLLSLEALGYVRLDERLFSLTPRVLELGYAYLSTLPLRDIAQPHLDSLTATVHESSSLAVLDCDDVVYVARAAASRITAVTISVGTRLPAYATSLGRVLLAGLPRPALEEYLRTARPRQLTDRTITDPVQLRRAIDVVRSQGFAIVDQELESGLRSAAAPVRERFGTVTAAVNVSTLADRVSAEAMRHQLVPTVMAAAARIEADARALS